MRKPDPEVYLIALERLGCAPASAVAIEDSGVGGRGRKGGGAGLPGGPQRLHAAPRLRHSPTWWWRTSAAPEPPATVVANPHGIDVGPVVGVDTLRRLRAAAS